MLSGNNSYTIASLPLATSFSNPALQDASDWGPYPSTMSSRNSFRGPGAWNVDASLSKTFPLHEQINLEFRAEAFNFFNHHNLYLQQSLFDIGNYNVIDGVPTHNGIINPKIIASKGGIGSNNGSHGANDERRYGQFALKVNF